MDLQNLGSDTVNISMTTEDELFSAKAPSGTGSFNGISKAQWRCSIHFYHSITGVLHGEDKITSRVCLGCRVFPYFSPKAESAQANPGTAAPSASLSVVRLSSIRTHRGFHQAPEFLQKNPFQSGFPVLHAEMQLTGERLDAVQTHHRAALDLKGRITSPLE